MDKNLEDFKKEFLVLKEKYSIDFKLDDPYVACYFYIGEDDNEGMIDKRLDLYADLFPENNYL